VQETKLNSPLLGYTSLHHLFIHMRGAGLRGCFHNYRPSSYRKNVANLSGLPHLISILAMAISHLLTSDMTDFSLVTALGTVISLVVHPIHMTNRL
jgi:hypothetical protein